MRHFNMNEGKNSTDTHIYDCYEHKFQIYNLPWSVIEKTIFISVEVVSLIVWFPERFDPSKFQTP